LPGGTSGTTGNVRTAGPDRPDSPLPNTLAYKQAHFFGSYSEWVIQEMVRAMNLDYDMADDRRVWFNPAPRSRVSAYPVTM